MVDIPEDELLALREQAASAIPWRSEAERLAEALRAINPDAHAISNELWREHFKSKASYSPVVAPEEAEVDG